MNQKTLLCYSALRDEGLTPNKDFMFSYGSKALRSKAMPKTRLNDIYALMFVIRLLKRRGWKLTLNEMNPRPSGQ